jgi:hypothetical protein
MEYPPVTAASCLLAEARLLREEAAGLRAQLRAGPSSVDIGRYLDQQYRIRHLLQSAQALAEQAAQLIVLARQHTGT